MVGVLLAVVQSGTTVCVNADDAEAVGTLDALIELGIVVSVQSISTAGMLDAVVALGTTVSV